MADSDKNIVIRPNRGVAGSTAQPQIRFVGQNNDPITLRVLDMSGSSAGTLSFEGSAGQLFAISNALTSGSLFSVNDISGLPSIDVNANGTILFAGFTGNVGIGATAGISGSAYRLTVIGSEYVTQGLMIGAGISITGGAAVTGGMSVFGGVTFGNDIYAPNMVTGVNGITGGVSITNGSNITITQSGKTITIASSGGGGSSPLATSSITGVASFPNADFSVSAVGAVSLTGNVARTHVGQSFTGLQVFSSGLSANGLTGTILTPSQTNITALGTLTSLNTAGMTSTQRVTISAGGLSVAGNIDGTIGTAAQPNITSLGTLTSLNTAGMTSTQRVTISSGGLSVAGNIDGTIGTAAQPNITSLGTLTSLNTAGMTSTQRVTISAGGLSVAGNIDGTIGTAAQPNITSLGTLTSLNTAGMTSTQRVTISSGGLSVAGNIDGTIGTAAQPNITSLGSLTTLTTAGLTSTQRVNVSAGGIVVQAGGLSVTGGANLTGGSIFFGDIEVYDGAFIRTGGLSVTGGIAGTLVTPAQTNITSLGTLTSLTTSGLLSTQALNVVAGATFGIDIYAPNLVTGVNGITGAVSITSGANVTITQSGKTITIAAAGGGGGGSSPLATSSVTGVASFPNADFSVSSVGAVSLTGNVARTNISQTFSSVQGFAGGFTAAGATFTAQVNMSSNTLYQPTLRYYNEPTSSPTISAGTLTLDLSAAQIFTVSLNAAITTLSITNTPATASRAIGFTLIFTADGTARSVTWGGSILWPSGTAPTLTSTNNKRDAFSFITTDGGTTWLGFVGGQNF